MAIDDNQHKLIGLALNPITEYQQSNRLPPTLFVVYGQINKSLQIDMKKILPTLFFLALLPLAVPPISALSLFGGSSDDELLDPATAFATQALINQDGRLQIDIAIADGYYLYKDKIKVDSDSATIGELTLPAGILKKDEFFGEVETYRGLLSFDTAITAHAGPTVPIVVSSQGCADIGVCYPPQKTTLSVEIPESARTSGNAAAVATAPSNSALSLNSPTIATSNATSPPPATTTSSLASTSTPSASLTNTISGLGNALIDKFAANSTPEVLDPEDAFVLQIEPAANNQAILSWIIADGHYLYRDKFSFVVTAPEQVRVGEADITRGKLKTDEFFGEVEVNRNFASATLTLENLNSAGRASIKVGYQGCADIGICYPPQSKIVEAAFQQGDTSTNPTIANQSNSGSIALTSDATAPATTEALQSSASLVSEQDRLASSLKSGNRLTTIATFFGMGLLLAFTPCVLPMVPILSSLIAGQGQGTSTKKAFLLSLIYVLAMALTYTIAGVLVGLSGENIQATLQHPAVLITFALLFVILAASMFGLFKLEMPSFVQNKLTDISNRQQGGSLSGVAVMGVLSALIVGPCVTAPLVGALIYIGQTGDAVLGGAALFALSMGMGVPLLIIGTSFGKYLPTAGSWMNTINAVFGVMLLAVAIWLLERVIPSWSTMLLSALLLISVGFFLGAFDSNSQQNTARKLFRGFGYAAIVYGTLLIIGIATGQGTLIRPLQGLALSGQSSSSATEHVAFTRIKGLDQLDSALASAQVAGKPVILDFYADWCISCKEMEAFTFTNPNVAAKMNQAILLQTDVTANDAKDKALLRRFNLYGPPAIIFYNSDGDEQSNARVVGYMNAEKFGNHLDIVFQ